VPPASEISETNSNSPVLLREEAFTQNLLVDGYFILSEAKAFAAYANR
jgi:hypothetical protein